MESAGEDTYLNQCFSRAMVEGYQGTGSLKEKGRIAACVKHFAGYGAPTGGRDYNTVELSERTLRENYLPAYQAGIEAGAAAVMASFNTLDRIPSTGNKKLLRNILRKEMGFDGVLISDWAAIEELIAHGVAADKKEAAKLALEAGMDIDMMTTCYCRNLKELIEEGSISTALLDEAVLRILNLKNELGLFENPFKDAEEEEERQLILCEEHRRTAKETAIESMVLLKNEGILPLDKESAANGDVKIAVIGPYASYQWISGVWSIFARIEENISLETGIKNLGLENICFAKGSPFVDTIKNLEMNPRLKALEEDMPLKEQLLARALELAKAADVVVLALGEHPQQSGEATSRTGLSIPAVQMELLNKIYEVNQNIAVVLFGGRPLTIEKVCNKAKAVLEVWLPGTEGGNAIAEVLFGDAYPSGKLSMSFPYNVGQVPVFYSEFNTGRPYRGQEGKYLSKYIDVPNAPLFPFGYGLSYTQFEISDVTLSRQVLNRDTDIQAAVKVRNTGNCTGKEVVQMYVQDVKGSVVRPVKELKGFQKIELRPGEEREVSFTITEKMLRFYDINMNYTSEPGEFIIYVGNCSDTTNSKPFYLE